MNRWGSGIVLVFAAVSLAGCFRHESRASDEQSHWLQACETSAQCGSALSCLCGVCTEGCAFNAECGGTARCMETDGLDAECTGAIGSVCLAACDADRACEDDDELACVQDACVGSRAAGGAPDAGPPMSADVDGGAIEPQPDAGPVEPQPDAGPVEPQPDAGPVEGRVPTENGYLTCDEIRERLWNLTAMLTISSASCEVDADCTCVSADTECDGHCAVAIHRDFADSFAQQLATVSGEYCIMPEFRATCGQIFADCRLCSPQCIDNVCEGYAPVANP